MIKNEKFLFMDSVVFTYGDYEATIIPEVGANLVRLYNKKYNLEILRYPKDAASDFKNSDVVYGIPVLFFPNRIEGGTFTVADKTYIFPQNEGTNFLHGFLHNKQWSVTKTEVTDRYSKVELTFNFTKYDDFYKHFPHEFDFTLSYVLNEKGLTQHTSILNRSNDSMPMGLGYHTTFNLPLVNDYKIKMGIEKKWDVKSMIPSGKFIKLSLIEQEVNSTGASAQNVEFDEMLYTIKPIEHENFKGSILKDITNNINIYYQWGDGFDFAVLWNYGGDKGFLCIEPQTWAVNAPNIPLPNDVTGFKLIEPNEKWEGTCSIFVKE